MLALPRLRTLGLTALAWLCAIAANAKESLETLRARADQGEAVAQNELGCIYENGEGVKADFDEAAKWYRRAADQGHAMAQGNLGLCYKNGDGIEKNLTEAAKWFRAAALAGESSAMFNLGRLHELGDGVEKDSAQAYAYYKVAALDYDDHDSKRRLAALLKASSFIVITKGDLAAVALKADIAAAKKRAK
jgi:TPR repeat protein